MGCCRAEPRQRAEWPSQQPGIRLNSDHRLSQLHIQTTHWLKLRRGLHAISMRLRSQKAPQGEPSLPRTRNRRKAATL
eukprot:9914951-Alexandrium_andersonii.AAC.1